MEVLPGGGKAAPPAHHPPALPRHMLSRPELLERLDDRAPLTVVSGVQGYGKTTLLAEWARERARRGLATVWITASAELNERSRLMDALQQAWSGIAVEREIASAALGGQELSADADQDLAIVIDDFQSIDDADAIRAVVDVAKAERGVRVVVSTRRRHPIEALASAETEVRMVLSRELLMSARQIEKLSVIMGRPISAENAAQLYRSIGGWAAAVRIVLELFRDDGPLPLAAVHDYFSATVFPAVQDGFVLNCLMRFALPHSLDVDVVRALSGDDDPDLILEALERDGLLERRYAADRIELHMPTLVKDLLREKFETLMPVEARAAHAEFARWYAESSRDTDLIAAFEHAVRAQDPEPVLRLWRRHATLFSIGFPRRLHGILSDVPAAVAEQEPTMRVARDSLAVFARGIGRDVDGTAAWFRAFADAGERALRSGSGERSLRDLLHLAAARMIHLRLQGLFEQAAAYAREVTDEVNERLSLGEEPGDRLGWFHLQAALSHRILGDEVEAVPAYRLAWEHAARSGIATIEANAAAGLALMYAYRSDLRRATTWLDRFHDVFGREHWAAHLVTAPAMLAKALMSLDRLDDEAFMAARAEGEDAAASLDAWHVIAYVEAQHALQFGDADAALAALDEAERSHPMPEAGQERAIVLLDRARADLLLKAGRLHETDALIRRRPRNGLLVVPRARVHLLTGDIASGRKIVAEHAWDSRRRLRDRAELLLIDVALALRSGDADSVRRTVPRLLEIVRSTSNPRVLTTIGRADLDEALRIADVDLSSQERAVLDRVGQVYPEYAQFITLTERERMLLAALDEGLTRNEIAERLFLSVNTVKTQLGALYDKLGGSSKDDVLHQARRLHLM